MLDASAAVAPENIVQEYASRALTKTNDYGAAAKMLEGWARAKPDLLRALTEPFLASACLAAVSKLCRDQRRVLWTAANYSVDGKGERLRNFAKSSLLDFRLPGGKLLRDANADDLAVAIDSYRKQAKTMQNEAAWFEAVAAKIGKKKVGSVFDDEALTKLKVEVCDE